jgi:hypothetical protein
MSEQITWPGDTPVLPASGKVDVFWVTLDRDPDQDRWIPSKVPDLRGVPLGVLPALGGDEGPTFASGI